MSDDKDDLNGFDGLGKINDDGMHFSEEELEAAMAGFEKEFQDEEAAQQNDAPAQVPFDQPDETVNSDASSDESQDGLQSKEADAVLSEAENSLSFDDELQGVRDSGVETVDSASLTRDDAMKILAEHTRFGRGSSSIE